MPSVLKVPHFNGFWKPPRRSVQKEGTSLLVFLKFLVRSVLGQNELNSLYHLELQTFATVMPHQVEKDIYALKIQKIVINNSNVISYVLQKGR